ncbi:hypothetical protein NUW54_g1264 [Trametes sanguinea]|uniref:Uncharacterized protein n=1 Tax=Trametes sanguinea TaxID=158606 RepID=A0ACC1Q8A6_9APHY|nr:hypothetical protein NUW54_g1264 [Trametes sanguinea]
MKFSEHCLAPIANPIHIDILLISSTMSDSSVVKFLVDERGSFLGSMSERRSWQLHYPFHSVAVNWDFPRTKYLVLQTKRTINRLIWSLVVRPLKVTISTETVIEEDTGVHDAILCAELAESQRRAQALFDLFDFVEARDHLCEQAVQFD